MIEPTKEDWKLYREKNPGGRKIIWRVLLNSIQSFGTVIYLHQRNSGNWSKTILELLAACLALVSGTSSFFAGMASTKEITV